MQDDLYRGSVLRDAHMMGINPDIPFHDLNLAGAQGVPSPDSLARASHPAAETNAPTFALPDTSVPPLAAYDLVGPGINLHAAFAADPQVPDLSDYDHPYGLDILPDMPTLEDPASTVWPGEGLNGQDIPHDLLAADPLVPDLQHPDLTQQRHMQERPGDLAASALGVMHLGATYQQLADKAYPEVFMDQAGMNTPRARHMDLLMRGLDEEEQ
jgi:hypothetical protein